MPVSTLFHLQFDRTSGQLEERNVILLAQVVKPLGKWVFSTISQRSYGPIQINYFIAFIPQQIFSLSPSVHHNPGHLSLHMWAAKKTRPCSMKTSLLETPPWFSCVGSVQFTQSDWEGGSLLILGILIVVMWLVMMILINIIMISMIKWSWSR